MPVTRWALTIKTVGRSIWPTWLGIITAAIFLAAGQVANASSGTQTMGSPLRADGTWYSGSPGQGLAGVVTISANDAWAVGESPAGVNSQGGTIPKTLLLHWNGTAWSQVVSPKPVYGELAAVAAVSASDVWVVGYTSNPKGTDTKGLIMHWNGTSWRRDVSAPAISGTFSSVATGAGNVWVLGYGGSLGVPLILHQASGRWYVIPSNLPIETDMGNVTVTGAKSAWTDGDSVPEEVNVVLHWNGSTWRRVASPLPGSQGPLLGVASGPNGTVWLFGFIATAGVGTEGVSYLWTGKAWRRIAVPHSISFNAIGAIPGGGLWGVGGYLGSIECGADLAIPIARWNGTSWVGMKTRIQGCLVIDGVAASSANNAWAVGGNIVTNEMPLIIHWNGKTWS